MKYFWSLLFTLAAWSCMGQENGKLKIVNVHHTKGGDLIYKGYIAQTSTQDTLDLFVVKISAMVQIPRSQIISIEDAETTSSQNVDRDVARTENYNQMLNDYAKFSRPRFRPYDFPDNVFYGRIELDFHRLVASIGASVGYRFRRMFSLGLGVSYGAWSWDPQPAGVTTVFLQSLGYFRPENNSFYYIWEAGGAFPKSPDSINDGWTNYSGSKPGYYGSFGIGWRWRGAAAIQNSIEMGVQFANMTYEDFNSVSLERKYNISRVYVTFGTMF